MQKSSLNDVEGQTYGTATISIGRKGVDLRQSVDPDALTSLVNAQFVDDTTVTRRTGHTKKTLQDTSLYSIAKTTDSDQWVYGAGTIPSGETFAQEHNPVSSQALHTFSYRGDNVTWTGDRLLIQQDNSTYSLGNSGYWSNTQTRLPIPPTTSDLPLKPWGIPCYLPSLTDSIPPLKATGTQSRSNPTPSFAGPFTTYADSCDMTVGGSYRALVYVATDLSVTAQILDKETNTLISSKQLATSVSSAFDSVRVVYSANRFVFYWLNTSAGQLNTAAWTGTDWTVSSLLFAVDSYDIQPFAYNSSYLLVYRAGSVIKARMWLGSATLAAPFSADTVVTTTGSTPAGPVACAISPVGNIAVVWYATTGYFTREFGFNLATLTGHTLVQVSTRSTAPDTCTIAYCSNLRLINSYTYTVYCGYRVGTDTGTHPSVIIGSVFFNPIGAGVQTTTFDAGGSFPPETKFNVTLASRAFNVGGDMFVWMRSNNFPLYFLVSGVYKTRVCGYADLGESAPPASIVVDKGRILPSVTLEPGSTYTFNWARRIITSRTGSPNTIRYSVINFLPQITSAQYGNSMYLSGSAVQNFDGYEVSDAGFGDIPLVSSNAVFTTGGSLSAGAYSIRAYLVRYNAQGERFVSSAQTSSSVTVVANGRISWDINPVTSCTAQDAIIEVYRTLAGGTTYFYEGFAANDRGAATINFVSNAADSQISQAPADPYQAQLGGLPEAMNSAPIGCTTLVTYNDRLWLAGGQVPRGSLVISKLRSPGFGAGWDILRGNVIIDSQGGDITSLCGMNNSMVAFERDKIFVLEGDGPDNFGRGFFNPAQFAAAKGAITHFGTKLTDAGVVYWNEGGPHLLTGQFTVQNISDPVRPLAVTLTPTGVRLNPQRQEVIWYTTGGTALLWDYKMTPGRWATWSNLFITSASDAALTTTDGLVYIPSDSVYSDGGMTYEFSGRTSHLRVEGLLSGYNLLRRYGVVGTYQGLHSLTLRAYYNGSPLWEEAEEWTPEVNTYLQVASTFGSLTAAQVDLLTLYDKSGNYTMHRRAKRQNCQRFQLEFADNSPDGPSFSPQSLEFELGVRPGFGRQATPTITDK